MPLYQLTVNAKLHEQICQNSFWFEDQTIDRPNGAQLLAEKFDSQIFNKMRLTANQELQYTSIKVQTIVPQFGAFFEIFKETSNGAQLGESLPGFAAMVVSLGTGFGGRSRRGRFYLPGVSEPFSQGGKISVEQIGLNNELAVSLYGTFRPGAPVGDGFVYGVWSRKLGNPTPNVFDVAAGFRPVTQLFVRRTLGTMRHRKIGVGN